MEDTEKVSLERQKTIMQEKERIEKVYEKVMELIHTTNELGELYPEKSFKLDGILLGNIGAFL